MANYLVQDVANMPKGMRFRVIKTKMEEFLGKAMEIHDNTFKTLYFGTRKEANAARTALVSSSVEPIFGMFTLFGVSNKAIAEWLHESEKIDGIGNYEVSIGNAERWFRILSPEEQAQYQIEYAAGHPSSYAA